MPDYWVGQKIGETRTIIVYDPTVQISDEYVYLFNQDIFCIEQRDREQARNSTRKIRADSEPDVIKAYQKWLITHAGKLFLTLIRKFKDGVEVPNYLYKLYNSGYRDGYAKASEREFDARMPEVCRREYNRGYMDGANDVEAEESLTALNESEDENEYYDFDNDLDLEIEEDLHRQRISLERIYIDKLLRPETTSAQDEYEQYLKSDHWLITRINSLVSAKFCCQSCGREENLEVHHKTYVRRGKELSADLIVLCYGCHRKMHPDKAIHRQEAGFSSI